MQKSLSIYDFKENEIIASVGASSGLWEIWFASQVDNLTFYIQDIDEQNCNQEEIDYGVQYYEKLLNKKIVGKFIPIVGTPKETNLPPDTFNKALIINSLHEFLYPERILKDIAKSLKVNGRLFIEEVIAIFSGEVHEGCGKRLFTEAELISLLHQAGFSLTAIHPKQEHTFIYTFTVSTKV